MKKSASLSFLAIAVIMKIGVAQIGPPIEWQSCFGGTANDYNPRLRKISDVGFIMLTSTNSNNGNVSGNHGGYDGWAAKLDSAGAIEWQHCYGGSAADYSGDVISDVDGGYILEIYSNSSNGQVQGSHGGSEIWIVKTDSQGNLLWQHPLGGSTSEIPGSMIQLPDSSIIICGYALSNDGDVSGNHGNGDAWVVKLKNNGTIIWQHCYGGTQTDYATNLIQLSDGNCLVAGYTYSDDDDVSGNHGGEDAWAFKIDTAGNLLWQHCYGGSGDEFFSALKEYEGSIKIGGSTSSSDGDVNSNHGGFDFWVVKTDEDGNLSGQKCFGGSGNEVLSSLVQKPGNGFAVCGESNSNDGDVIGNHGSVMNDGWIMRADSSFNLVWSRCYGGSGSEFGFRMVADEDHLLVAGSTNSDDDDVDCTDHGLIDIWFFLAGDECDIPIQAAFAYQQFNLTYSFTDQSNKASSWLWDFGDGNTSTQKNAIHTYATDGIYQVCLGVTDSCGYDSVCTIINTCGYAVADYGYEQNDLTFSFSDSSQNVTSWLWYFGDGNTSTEENPDYTYAAPGIYNVKLVVSNACNADSIYLTINTCGSLIADFDYTTLQLAASFTDSSTSNADQWVWDFGDGDGSTQENPVHIYALPGLYTVSLLAADDCEVKVVSKTITVCALVQAAFSITSSAGEVSLTNSSLYATSFSWDFGNGVTTSLVNPEYYFSDTGFYSICLHAENICSSGDSCALFHNDHSENINFCWENHYSENNATDHAARFIGVDDSSNVISVGYSESADFPLLYKNLYTIKYDPQGNLVWKKNLADDFPDDYFQPIDLVIDHQGNSLILFSWQQSPSYYDNWGVVKYNSQGILLWTIDGELTDNERATAMALDKDGNVIVAGSGFGLTFTGDYLIEKIGVDGNKLWKKSYDYAGFIDGVNDVVVSSGEKIYVTGAAVADEFDEHEKMVTVEYDADGNFQSDYTTGVNFAAGKQIATNKSGDVWILGGDSYFGEDPITYVQRIGSTSWISSYSGPLNYESSAQGISIAVDSSDEAMLIAQVDYDDASDVDQTYPVLLKYDGEGNLTLEKELPATYFSDNGHAGFVLKKMIANDAGKVFYTGYSKPADDENNSFDVETGKLNLDGTTEWIAQYDAANLEDHGNDIVFDHSGNILVAGTAETDDDYFEMLTLKYCIECTAQPVTFSLPQDTFCITSGSYSLNNGSPPGGEYYGDGVINGVFYPDSAGVGEHQIMYAVADADGCVTTDSLSVMVDICLGVQSLDNIHLNIFPNPFSEKSIIQFSLTEQKDLVISLLDVSGKKIKTITSGTFSSGSHSIPLYKNDLASGIYLLRFEYDDNNGIIRKIAIAE